MLTYVYKNMGRGGARVCLCVFVFVFTASLGKVYYTIYVSKASMKISSRRQNRDHTEHTNINSCLIISCIRYTLSHIMCI